jgi:hypothetical protein
VKRLRIASEEGWNNDRGWLEEKPMESNGYPAW